MQTARGDQLAGKKSRSAQTLAQNKARTGSWLRVEVLQYKAPPTQGNTKNKVKNTLARSSRGKEPK